MRFYLNEIGLIESWPDQFTTEIEEFQQIYEKVTENGYEIFVKDSFFSLRLIEEIYAKAAHEYYPFVALIGTLPRICVSRDLQLIDFACIPEVSHPQAIELLKLCLQDEQKEIVSTSSDSKLTNATYQIHSNGVNLGIYNLKGLEALNMYLIHNPPCKSVKEVFDKAKALCKHLYFSKHAYSTAKKRETQYRNFGYEKLLDALIQVDNLLYPYLSGKVGSSQKAIEKRFKELAGVEFSFESEETMKMFGE